MGVTPLESQVLGQGLDREISCRPFAGLLYNIEVKIGRVSKEILDFVSRYQPGANRSERVATFSLIPLAAFLELESTF